MKIKLATSLALGFLIWLAFLSPVVRQAPVASADPVGVVDPLAGSVTQTFTFTFQGFQPFTPLTLSVLQPGAAAFTIIETPVPIITNELGQAQFPFSVISLLDPTLAGIPGVPLYISWTGAPGAYTFRADACDRVNCVEFVGNITTP